MSAAAVAATTNDAGYVPVQLTAITPVRVYDVHGEYFETEIDLDAPMRVLQLAVEDYFKVKPEVQLLLHNRQQVNPELTLRGNGCLLLKGDPYVRLVLVIKRGPVLNLVCHTAGAHQAVYPIAIHERSTVWEAKQMLCAEMAARQQQQHERAASSIPTPQQLRLLWRYMELNDRAELHYYRIPTNSVLSVRVRRGGVGVARSPSTSPPNHHPASPAVGNSSEGRQSWARLRQRRGGPAPLPTTAYDPRGAPLPPPQQVVVPPASFPPPPPFPPPQPLSSAAVAAEHDADVRALRQMVQALQSELAQLRGEVALQEEARRHATGASATATAATQFTAAASHRIQELEDTVGRFQVFLQRALALIP